jgi:asparagine synthase (glutamine-hydrolysing)
MPGICGIIGADNAQEDKKKIRAMAKSMMHEKFYVSGTYSSDKVGLSVGWVCREGSFSDCLPIWSERKDVCLVFCGENFLDESEIEDIKAKGHEFNKETASYIVHMYEEIGFRFLEKLNGWFCGVMVDFREEKAFLFNDRYGLGRLYVYENEGGTYFSSEAKALLSVLPELRQLDMDSLSELLGCGRILGKRTMFRSVSLLPGGSVWTWRRPTLIKKEKFFAKDDWEKQSALPEEQYYEEFKQVFSRILPKYLSGRERVGISLTGGIDTRMIMAWAPLDPFKVPCYTFSGMYRDCADARIARKVAVACQQRHETISLNRKFFSEFPALAKRAVYYTDGTMDVSGSVELYVNKLARGIAPVRLTGNYGDQVVRQVIGFKRQRLWEGMFQSDFYRGIAGEGEGYDENGTNKTLSGIVFNKIPAYFYGRLALEQTQVASRSPFLDNEIVALVFRAPSESVGNLRLSLRLIADGSPPLGRIPTDRGVVYSPLPLLNKVRRLYEEFISKAEYAYDYGMPEWVRKIDKILRPLQLEKRFLGRNKFYHFRAWYRDELSKYVKDILLDPRTLSRPYLNGKGVEEIVNSHTLGHRNFTQEIHWLLTIELIERNLIEKN